MTTTTTRLETRLAELTKARAERLDPLDFPRTWTQRQCNTYTAETVQREQELAALRAAAETLAALPIEDDQRWRDHLVTWRKTLCDELMTIKSPLRDPTLKARAHDLEFGLKLIDFGSGISRFSPIVDLSHTCIGELMLAAGYHTQGEGLRSLNGWRGSLPEVQHRLTFVTAERAKAEQVLAALLLTDAEREKLDTEIAAFRVTLNEMDIRGGDALTAFDTDGNPLPIESMTDAQKAAFTWFERVACPPRESSTV